MWRPTSCTPFPYQSRCLAMVRPLPPGMRTSLMCIPQWLIEDSASRRRFYYFGFRISPVSSAPQETLICKSRQQQVARFLFHCDWGLPGRQGGAFNLFWKLTKNPLVKYRLYPRGTPWLCLLTVCLAEGTHV